jgi:hypothetical protein
VNYDGGSSLEIITFLNGAAIDPSDVLFSAGPAPAPT